MILFVNNNLGFLFLTSSEIAGGIDPGGRFGVGEEVLYFYITNDALKYNVTASADPFDILAAEEKLNIEGLSEALGITNDSQKFDIESISEALQIMSDLDWTFNIDSLYLPFNIVGTEQSLSIISNSEGFSVETTGFALELTSNPTYFNIENELSVLSLSTGVRNNFFLLNSGSKYGIGFGNWKINLS